MDDLYKDIILDHYRNPRNRGVVDNPDAATRGYNPLCGDEIELSLKMEDGRVAEVKSLGRGCSISLASASMMTEMVKGKSLEEALALIGTFKGMLLEDRELQDEEYDRLGDLEALEGLKSYPVRIKCALLSWNALSEVLGMAGAAGAGERVESRRKTA
jgi:nitrogen fixation protein NifU and related proteins